MAQHKIPVDDNYRQTASALVAVTKWKRRQLEASYQWHCAQFNKMGTGGQL